MIKTFRNNAAGFTLTEMAMVVMIMGIIGSILVTSLNARMSQTSYTVTKQRMAAIKDAMISFLRVNGRLPCPDGNTDAELFDGIEDPLGGGVCDNGAFGVLPYSTLRLSREQVIDGWGNFFSYHVSQTTDPWTTEPPGTDPINDTYLGELIIENTDNNVVMVVVSHGPNGTGAYTIKGTRNALPSAADELENTNDTENLTYIERDFTDNINAPGGLFDDVVAYMTVSDLVGPLIKEGSVQSSAATSLNNSYLLMGKFQKIKNALFQYAASDLGDPYECQYKPWGANLPKVANDTVVPTRNNGYYYTAQNDGVTSSTTEPTWTTDTATILDGTVSWEGNTLASGDVERHYRHRLPTGENHENTDPELLPGKEHGIVNADGWVPYKDLNLTLDDVTDPWGNRIIYAVDTDIANENNYNAGIYLSTNKKAYRLISFGPINDSDHNTNTSSTGPYTVLTRGCNKDEDNNIIHDADDICEDVPLSDIASAIVGAGGRLDTATCP